MRGQDEGGEDNVFQRMLYVWLCMVLRLYSVCVPSEAGSAFSGDAPEKEAGWCHTVSDRAIGR